MDADSRIPQADPEQESVGSILRRCRMDKALSLQDAEEATKISKNYLLALEEDRYEEFPSPVYLKGFLRTYATWLGLQGEELSRLTDRSGVVITADPAPPVRSFSGFSSINWQRLALPAILLGALIVSSIFLTPSEPPSTRTVARPQEPQATVAVAPSAAVQPTVSSALKPAAEPELRPRPSPEGAHSPEAQAPAPVPAAAGVLVRIKALRNSTVSVVLDEGVSQSYDLTGGDLIEWKAARTIALDISDTDSIAIELNGSPLKLQAPAGKQTYVVLDAAGMHR